MSVGRRLAVHLTAWVVALGVIRVAVLPAEICPAVDSGDLRESIYLTVDWVERNQFDNGRYTYGVFDDGSVNEGYNGARHAGVTMALFQAAAVLDDPEVMEPADAALEFAFADLIEHDDWMAWSPGANAQLGANSLLLAALLQRRLYTGDPVHDDLMRSIGRFLQEQQVPDGRMLAAWSPATEEPIPDRYGKFATGEAAWALTLMERVFPGEGWAASALDTIDYMATDRVRVEPRLTRFPDHWAAYALSELEGELLDETRIGYARRLAGFFGIRLRFESQRTGEGINLLVRWHPGPPAGAGTGGEGIGALWRLSLREPRLEDLRPNIEDRLECAGGFLVERQIDRIEAEEFPDPVHAAGAWFYRGYSQMDDQQHVLSTLTSALQLLEERER